MHIDSTNTTTPTKALLIKNWHIYFENGQTRRIKNLTYSLSPVDHSSITRKALLRKGAAGHTALAVFSELIGLAARRLPQGLRKLLDAEKERVKEGIAVACHAPAPRSNTPPRSPQPVACHTNKPASAIGKNVARHSLSPKCNYAPTVACHTERVDIQKKPITPTKEDRRAVERFVKDLETTGLLGGATVRVKNRRADL